MSTSSTKFLITLLTGFCLLLIAFGANAQHGSLRGTVFTNDNQPAAFVNLYLKELKKGAISEENGDFHFRNLPAGSYTLITSLVGLKPQEQMVLIEAGKITEVNLALQESGAQLSEVQITGRRSANDRPVSVGKMAARPMDLPQSVAVVGSEVIAEQQASKLSDVIKNVNGVALGTTRGSTSETFFARGYNLGANNILKNGMRSNSAVIPEASTLERVEVLKGSAALLYGNVSGGAVINMVTKQPKFNFGGEVAMRAGSYNLYKPILDVYGPISQKLAYRVIGTYETAGSYRNGVSSERYYVNPSLLYKLSDKTDILVQGDYLKNDFTPDFGIGSVDGKIPASVSRSVFFNTPWAYNQVTQTNTSVAVNHQLNHNWKLNFIAGQQLFDRNYFSTERIQANAAGDWGRRLTRSKIKEHYYTGQLNLTGTVQTGKIGHSLLIGTDAERYLNTTNAFRIASLGNGGVYDTINLLDPHKFVARTDEPLATNISRTETPTYRFGYYAQDLISFSEKVKVLAGLRWSYQKVAVARTFDLEVNTDKRSAEAKYDRAFSPRLGIVYQPVATTSFFASYSNNFVPNSGTDVYKQNLKPSIIDQYEVGVKNDLLKNRLSVNLTFYKIINNDLAQQAQFLADGTTLNTDATIKEFTGQTTSDGAQIDLNGTLTKGLNFLAGYSYNFMRFTKTSGLKGSYIEGERLVSNPAHTANVSLFYTLQNGALKGLKIGASGFYTGERYGGWNNTVGQTQQFNRLIPVSGFTTIDLSLGYTWKSFSVLTKLSNVTNELNYLVHENYSINPIPPRQFLTTVSYKF